MAKRISSKEDNPKERILETASKLFYLQGYSNTGINQILEESKTFKLSFYNYFSSKENLGIEYIKIRETEFLAFMERLMKNNPTYESFVRTWIRFLRVEIKNRKYHGCPFINITLQTFGKEEVFKPHIKSMIQKWKKSITNFLIRSQAANKAQAEKMAVLIIQIFEGSVQLYMATDNIDYIYELEENLVSILN
ncbi:MAG TPA: TetR/AcrR family transcriptional regulator [Leptospiraceae bacterium]|nr:TetR/AcrR family transcriptional regulator [Leptospiraceae bacterium]HMW06326.1 TetR/AcrR family transcriptional regulator [Leptospiraceae bacterium]HMX30995.1 TetR/AcrR family transcriptional regulator [Leptospiraceae bacterium]HMY32186.1 TetR/AcrR family transcriptional regulator [Leptospiraceae bacterium]HMZ63813.1 TetR/AcrR family transcriptional regulator [Leptospiraceae bacterium]